VLGGGLFCEACYRATINNSLFENLYAQNGGAIYIGMEIY